MQPVVGASCIFRQLFIPPAVDFAENRDRLAFFKKKRKRKKRSAVRERYCLVWSVRNNPRPRPVVCPLLFLSLSLFLFLLRLFSRAHRVRGPTRIPGPTTKDEGPLRAPPPFCHRGCNNNRPIDRCGLAGRRIEKKRGRRKEERSHLGGGRGERRAERHAGYVCSRSDASRHLNPISIFLIVSPYQSVYLVAYFPTMDFLSVLVANQGQYTWVMSRRTYLQSLRNEFLLDQGIRQGSSSIFCYISCIKKKEENKKKKNRFTLDSSSKFTSLSPIRYNYKLSS